MKNFFKFLFASCLGTILASMVILIFGSLIFGAIASSGSGAATVKSNSVLRLTFKDLVPDKTNNVAADPYSFDTSDKIGLHDIKRALIQAQADNKIKGILLDLNDVGLGMASAEVIRESLIEFKKSDKFIIAHGKYFSEGAYYLASTADEIYINPLGQVVFDGFAAQIPFMKDLLDKVGIKVQVFYAGQFKSATEPYRYNEMSDQNRHQMREYLEDIYDNFLENISDSRNVPVKELQRMADELLIRDAGSAVEHGLIDGVKYKDEIIELLQEKLGIESDDKINAIGLSDYYTTVKSNKNYKTKDKIALIFAEGTILDGMGMPGQIGGDSYAKLIRKLRKKDDIKAIVLRVNSGGGDALASDIIWRELTKAKEQGIKIVVSMGDYAASGGYYIACMADSIYAEPMTLTGSIGVYKTIPSAQELLNERLGIHFDTVKTAKYAHGITPYYDVKGKIADYLQEDTDQVYEIFLSRVAEGRGMTRDEVHEVAQGRIWTGRRALEIGLVDEIGGLDSAIVAASKLAGLDSYRIQEYPTLKDPVQQMIDRFMGNTDKEASILRKVEKNYPYLTFLREITEMKGVQARLPYLVEWK